MRRHIEVLSLVLALALSARADAADWRLEPAAGQHGAVLTVGSGRLSYRFECAGKAVIVTETGVTRLMDLKTGKPVGDDARAVMPPGAAIMALFVGKGEPDFRPAEAAQNPAGGWDLTIRLPLDDRQLKAVARSEMISLFTTGETAVVPMDDAARTRWHDFLQSCKAAG
jgi:hypothetical protein